MTVQEFETLIAAILTEKRNELVTAYVNGRTDIIRKRGDAFCYSLLNPFLGYDRCGLSFLPVCLQKQVMPAHDCAIVDWPPATPRPLI